MPENHFFKNPLSIHTMTLCSLFTALIAIGAFIRIQFPVVPITMQTLFVILCALLLGAKRSAVSVSLYLFLGLAGLPVFTKGGGPGYVLQPTFGYLLGFLAAALVVGTLSQQTDVLFRRNPAGTASDNTAPRSGSNPESHGLPHSHSRSRLQTRPRTQAVLKILYYWGIGLIGILIIYLIGMVYMYFILKYYMNTPVGFFGFFTVDFLLTFAGDVFKCFVAAWLAVRLLPILRKTMRFSE